MDEKLKQMLDLLDEQQTALLLDRDIQYDMDKETLERIKASVRRKVGMKKKSPLLSTKLIAGLVAVILGFFTINSIGVDDITSNLRQVVESLPGYGMGKFASKGNTDEIPQQVLDMVENRRIMHSLTKEKLTIGDKGFRVNYIDDLKLKENALTLKELMKKEEQWLYIIEKQGESYLSMLVGKHQGKYNVLVYGGDAEMFYHILSLAGPPTSGKIELLSYGGDYYIINQDSQVYQIPQTRTEYEKNPDLFDSPISEKTCAELIYENYNNYINKNDSNVEFGSIGLVEQYHEKKDEGGE